MVVALRLSLEQFGCVFLSYEVEFAAQPRVLTHCLFQGLFDIIKLEDGFDLIDSCGLKHPTVAIHMAPFGKHHATQVLTQRSTVPLQQKCVAYILNLHSKTINI